MSHRKLRKGPIADLKTQRIDIEHQALCPTFKVIFFRSLYGPFLLPGWESTLNTQMKMKAFPVDSDVMKIRLTDNDLLEFLVNGFPTGHLTRLAAVPNVAALGTRQAGFQRPATLRTARFQVRVHNVNRNRIGPVLTVSCVMPMDVGATTGNRFL